MDLINEFTERDAAQLIEELERIAEDETNNIGNCVDCRTPMYINMESSLYVCNTCGRSEKYNGIDIAETDKHHKVTISANGKAYLDTNSVTTEDNVRRELNDMNMILNLHPDIIEKVFNKLIKIRIHIVNRGKVRDSIRAKCTIDICKQNNVLVSDDDIYKACGINNKKINDGVKLTDYAIIAGFIDDEKELEDDTEKILDTTIKHLELSKNKRNLLLLYVRQHQKLAEINRKPMSRIAGALYNMNIVLKMGIEKDDISKLTNVSTSTIDQIFKEFIDIDAKLSVLCV
jgi:transcription initiation factor TFIIIB Brf1 subunit/transcription initiation factor TFIIB